MVTLPSWVSEPTASLFSETLQMLEECISLAGAAKHTASNRLRFCFIPCDGRFFLIVLAVFPLILVVIIIIGRG